VQSQLDVIVHFTVRATHLPVPLTRHAVASWLWPRLRRAFPDALAVVLMPNHPHLVTLSTDVAASRQRFKNVLTGLRRSNNVGSCIRWEPLPPAEEVADSKMANRVVRYVALNPNRAGLVRDPLCWPWSTHRDAIGAIADPWVSPVQLARELGRSSHEFAERFHAYVSSDPSVCVTGTPLPQSALPGAVAEHPLATLIEAAAAATRGVPADIQRRGATRTLFLQLASQHGWRDTAQLAALCRISVRAVHKQRRAAVHAGLPAAQLCLGDPRLRVLEVAT
jgi:hypothetical protein